MVYLTADFAYPRDDIEESAEEFERKRPLLAEKYPFMCGWLSWRHLPVVYDREEDIVLRDLLSLAERLDMRFFGGISSIGSLKIRWHFERMARAFNFVCAVPARWSWRYSR
jgi:hypothetical protein